MRTCGAIEIEWERFNHVAIDVQVRDITRQKPAIALVKVGDTDSKIGDDVTYTITLSNNSSADTPDLLCTVEDTTIGRSETVTLRSQSSQDWNVTFTIPADTSDPFINSATATCSPDGFPNVYTAAASASTNLFQPAIALVKVGDADSKIGDEVTYTITLSNNSSADTPDLVCTVEDTTIGLSETVTLSSDASQDWNVTFTIPADASDPFVNTATATCSPDGFPNVYTTAASASTNLFQPAIALVKAGDTRSKVRRVGTESRSLRTTSQ